MADDRKPASSPKQGDKSGVTDLPQKNVPSKQSEDVKGGRMPEKIKP